MGALSQSVYYAIGIIMMKGVSLLMIPYLTRTLTVAEFGALESLVLLADIGTILFSFGLVDAMYRYVGTAEGKHKQQLISNCFSLSCLLALIGAVAIALSLNSLVAILPARFEPYQLLLLAIPILLDGLISIPLTLMRMQSMAKKFCQLNVAKALIQALLTFVLMEQGYGIDAVLIAACLSSIFLALALVRFQWQQMERFGHFADSAMLLRFGLPVLVGSVSVYMITGLDRWLLAEFVGVEQLAVYAIAVKFALLLPLILQPYALWWFPNRIPTLQKPDGEKKCAEMAILGVNFCIIVALCMALTVPSFLSLILPAEYHNAGLITVALLMVNTIKNAGDYLNLGCYCGESSQTQMWIHAFCAALAVAGYFYWVPSYGLWATVSVLAGVYLIRLMLIYLASQSIKPLQYAHRQWLITLAISITAWSLHQFVSPSLPVFATFLLGGVIGIASIALFAGLGILPIWEPIKQRLASRRKSQPTSIQ
ncbi:oligosaccharide flippase family protein [Vibrio sp. SCSIO 43135]|uniref:lipopolysaccharide biosynthesis protein n=1 Tax=Vibrio sp. SCSIO 43135 TaxID=2819096 RepID=UPI0020752E38|nr:oligosaccharide flippase family protein [Vibrio sp. SCSIO 43135]USD43541.1 oligosaccharide flippase family protein [Vibrio sp. SCSIO 43135]